MKQEQADGNSEHERLRDECAALREECRALREAAEKDRAARLEAEKLGKSLSEAFASSPEALAVVDAAGRVLLSNPAAERLLGQELARTGQWPFALPVSGQDQEIEVLTPLGGLVVAEVRAWPIRWLEEDALLVSLRDVSESHRMVQALREVREELEARVQERTRELRRANEQLLEEIAERVLTQEELSHSESRYRAILEDQSELICRYLPDGRLSYVNEAYVRYYGKSRADLMDRNFIPDIPAEDLGTVLPLISGLSKEWPVVEFEHRIRMEDGSIRWQRWTHRAIFGQTGELVEYQAVGRDVTKRKQAEDQAQEQRAFLRLIIDSLPNPIFVKDRRGSYVLVNKAMATLYGQSPDEMIGRVGADFNPDGEEIERFRREDADVLDRGTILYIPQKTITDSTGKKRWYTKTKVPLVERDLVLGVAVDVTDLLEAEMERLRLEKRMRQTQKMQALGTLAGGIAHDFNNMIYAILGFTDLSLRRAEDGKLRDYLEQIKSAGLRASELVRQILTFSRQTDQGRTKMRVSLLCKEITKMLTPTLPANVEVELKIETDRDTILGDPIQIHQVLLNLCTNSVHAMRERGGYMEIVLRDGPDGSPPACGEEAQDGCIELLVSDTGVGMDQATMERIFDPFFTTKAQGEGTGMGLSVVHGIVEAHGGTIRVESQPGHGSTFLVRLPRLRAEEECGSPDDSDIPRGCERILFVDDENLLAQMAGEMLAHLGYAVTSMTSAAEALELFKTAPDSFDLVITDQTMPGMTGAEFARAVMAVRPGMPVILITGFSEKLSEEEAWRMGIKSFLLKPVSESQLARAIREAL
ncbi:PAS/PAC sensor hybrid histidine kinase [Desulfovibrio sp. X2]|uniref:hybrid sensor histidine kinase/response regulator n=1 Tax=Desulfovibrio sp. X2 TaxID=941449 RepID=UPI00035878DC|nr:PAS domain-containing sensor histidine kinase [Desulfovibrio sp. X2]EPR43708.1 PAS/PAC sensor hybrid histidine kinase [Desulfovibrio sp. X2]